MIYPTKQELLEMLCSYDRETSILARDLLRQLHPAPKTPGEDETNE